MFKLTMGDQMEMLQIAEREPVVNHVYRELRQAILQGRFPPASRLIETKLAELLNVSRTPVREAVLRLESEGLVKRMHGKGLLVQDTRSKISEVVIIRQSLEGAAARLACVNASDDDIAHLVSLSHQGREAIDQGKSVKERAQLDKQFHMQLAHASHSQRLASLIEEFYAYSFSELVPSGHHDESELLQQQHIEIADAVMKRDAERAEAAVRQHLETTLQSIRARIG